MIIKKYSKRLMVGLQVMACRVGIRFIGCAQPRTWLPCLYADGANLSTTFPDKRGLSDHDRQAGLEHSLIIVKY